jgi:PPOX class probable F420-dependent enzyme
MQQMSDDRRRAFLLAGTRTGHLATTRADGSAHVAPIWFVLDGDDVLFTTGDETVKGRNLRRDPRAQLSVDQPEPPFAFVTVTGRVELIDDASELFCRARQIAARYMGEDQAEAFARRNAVPGELLVRLRPERFVATDNVAGC